MRDESDDPEQHESRRSRVVVLVGALVAVGLFAFLNLYEPQSPSPDSTTETASEPVALSTTVIESSPEPSAGVSGSTAPSRETQVRIFECVRDGQRIVSDRPCGDDAEPRTLSVSQPDPRAATGAQQRTRSTLMSVMPNETVSSSYPAPSVNESAPSNAAQCAAIDHEIDAINARMRQGGYGTQEGNWLRGRWHQLKNERYELKCRQTGLD